MVELKKFTLLSLLTFIITSYACNKNKVCNNLVEHQFEVPASLTPENDTFQIGDTIHFSSKFSNTVYDRNSEEFYNLEGFKFNPGTNFTKIDNEERVDAFDRFKILIDSSFSYYSYQFNDGKKILTGNYKTLNDSFILEYKYIPQDTGLYYVAQACDPSLTPAQSFPGQCNNILLSAYVKLNMGSDNNIHMLKDSPDSHYNDWVLQKPNERFHKGGGYCFYVKEE